MIIANRLPTSVHGVESYHFRIMGQKYKGIKRLILVQKMWGIVQWTQQSKSTQNMHLFQAIIFGNFAQLIF